MYIDRLVHCQLPAKCFSFMKSAWVVLQECMQQPSTVWKKTFKLSQAESKLIEADTVNKSLWAECLEMLPTVELVRSYSSGKVCSRLCSCSTRSACFWGTKWFQNTARSIFVRYGYVAWAILGRALVLGLSGGTRLGVLFRRRNSRSQQ